VSKENTIADNTRAAITPVDQEYADQEKQGPDLFVEKVD
jgi:hypothetical protein